MAIALGPVSYFWPRQAVEAFYAAAAGWPVDTVYLGETICGKRRALALQDWVALGEALATTGKEVVLSTQVLLEADSEVAAMERVCDNERFGVEANDMGAVQRLAGRVPFTAGAHLNIYNARALSVLVQSGAYRWVPPVELSGSELAALVEQRPEPLETEVFAFGRLPLAFSARCFTARAHGLAKDNCGFRCQQYPDGLPMHTQEGDWVFTINGVQLQSGMPCSLLAELPQLQALGVDSVRVSPVGEVTGEVVGVFRAVLDGDMSIAAGEARLDELGLGQRCHGFWHGDAGMVSARAIGVPER